MNTNTLTPHMVIIEAEATLHHEMIEALVNNFPQFGNWFADQSVGLSAATFGEVTSLYMNFLGIDSMSLARFAMEAGLDIIACQALGFTPEERGVEIALRAIAACADVEIDDHVAIWDEIINIIGNLDLTDDNFRRRVDEILENDGVDQEFGRFLRLELNL